MLTKNKIKLIQSLNRKKNRDETGLFLVEGNKMVEEALRSELQIELLVCTTTFLDQNSTLSGTVNELIETDSESLNKASLLQNPQDALALIKQPLNFRPEFKLNTELALVLDFIQDPGNLGTIFRIADWFGISSVICSENTVDCFNPKVVQASMGAIFRIKTWYTKLEDFLGDIERDKIPIYGTFLEGQNIYTEALTNNGVIVLGNEGNGISEEAGKFVSHRLFIPSFSVNENKTESLNVAIATAICCSEFRRR
jgi:TrmH family RNA methyltransferase